MKRRWYTASLLFPGLTLVSLAAQGFPAQSRSQKPEPSLGVVGPLQITKTAMQGTVVDGSIGSFTIAIRNNATTPATSVSVTDPAVPDCQRGVGTLPDLAANGGSFSYTCTTAPLSNDLTNLATVNATIAGNQESASDQATIQVISPAIRLIKTADTPTVFAGQQASFTIFIENLGGSTKTELEVEDLFAPACARSIGSLPDLGANESTSYTCQSDPLFADFTNTATVTASVQAGGTVSGSGSDTVTVLLPLAVAKTPEEQDVQPGGTVSFTISISNDGSEEKRNLTVSDPATPDCDRPLGVLPDLLPGESTSYTCQTGALFVSFTNQVTVTALLLSGDSISASDTAFVRVQSSAIEIRKEPASQLVGSGNSAAFTITVTNLGSSTKTNLAVSDPLTPDCERLAGSLADLPPGMSVSYTCSTGPLNQTFTNLATVMATDSAGGAVVTDGAAAFVAVVQPAIEVVKETLGTVIPGARVTFRITITNQGAEDKTNIEVVDPLAPDCDRVAGQIPDLAPGASFSYTCSSEPVLGPFTNVVIASADTASRPEPVTDSASSLVALSSLENVPLLSWWGWFLLCSLLVVFGLKKLSGT